MFDTPFARLPPPPLPLPVIWWLSWFQYWQAHQPKNA
jgi:hypothetical protein